MKENIAAFTVPIVLILCSILSPVNGLEEGSNNNPFEMLMLASITCVAGIAVFLILKRQGKIFSRNNSLNSRL